MANISDIVFCLNAINNEGEGASAINILPSITPEYIPGLFTFSIIIILLDIEPIQTHHLIVDFIAPNDETIVHIENPFSVQEDTSNLPKQYKGVNIAMSWNNVNFKVSGNYTLKIHVDGKFIKDKSIYVKGKNE